MSSRFETSLLQEISNAERSSLADVPLGDSHGHAALKGRRDGLQFALEQYRRLKSTNIDPDDDGF